MKWNGSYNFIAINKLEKKSRLEIATHSVDGEIEIRSHRRPVLKKPYVNYILGYK